jgi:phage host-nuclease inhibitor protein Gam
MPKITIDDIEYNTEDLTESGKAQLASLQFLEVQMQKLRNEIAIYQTAQRAYVAALKDEIVKAGIQPLETDAQPDE